MSERKPTRQQGRTTVHRSNYHIDLEHFGGHDITAENATARIWRDPKTGKPLVQIRAYVDGEGVVPLSAYKKRGLA